MSAPTNPRIYRFHEISAGMVNRWEYTISPAVYQQFLVAFDDRNPLHVDETYALENGFVSKVMHGSILNGFISHFVGMIFPGKLSMLLTVDLRFANPSYLGDIIGIEMTVAQMLDSRRVVVLNATLTNLTRNHLAARGRLQVMVREE